mmetsp:Transcript_14283/g.31016  ORF Transcript_14283/g.31016 Transcript_14283/m.31016 type:complete len:205 (+) Transcript_14283:72-686(+)
MKSYTATIALVCSCSTAGAFVTTSAPQHHHLADTATAAATSVVSTSLSKQVDSDSSPSSTALHSTRRDVLACAGGIAGWLLGPHLAHAAGAYVPESGYESLDFSLPSYKVDDNADLIGGVSAGGGGEDRSAPLADPVKEAERQAKLEAKKKAAAEKEAAKARAYYAKMKAKEAKEAEKAKIMAEVEAGRAAMREAKLKSKIPTE